MFHCNKEKCRLLGHLRENLDYYWRPCPFFSNFKTLRKGSPWTDMRLYQLSAFSICEFIQILCANFVVYCIPQLFSLSNDNMSLILLSRCIGTSMGLSLLYTYTSNPKCTQELKYTKFEIGHSIYYRFIKCAKFCGFFGSLTFSVPFYSLQILWSKQKQQVLASYCPISLNTNVARRIHLTKCI
jgi:hypothetical protein